MPVEIKELLIRIVATEGRESAEAPPTPQTTMDDTDAIIAACVKQVLKILKKSQER